VKEGWRRSVRLDHGNHWRLPLLCCLAAGLPAVAARPDSLRVIPAVRHDALLTLGDAAMLLSAPAHLDARQWAGGTSLAVLGMASTQVDEGVRARVQAHRTSTGDRALTFPELYGRGPLTLSAGAALYAGGLALGSPWTRETGRAAVVSIAYSGVVTAGLKYVVGRDRPYLGHGSQNLHWFGGHGAAQSFPSGHTTADFAFSSSLAARIHRPWAYPLLYGLASLTAVQRVYTDKHWTSDVLFGALIGAVVGNAVGSGERRHSGPARRRGAVRVRVAPASTGSGLSLKLSF